MSSSGAETVLDTYAGFAGDTAPPGTKRPSTDWPLQRFMWSDYAPPRAEVSYQAVPLTGDKDHLTEDPANATGWSDPVTVGPDVGDGISAYFNRGVVATQWLSRALRDRGGPARPALTQAISAPGDRIRNFLGGSVLWQLPRLLAGALASGGEIHAALFELDDPQLIEALQAFGPRAHVILANGADQPDENGDARTALRSKNVDVHDRLVSSSHFAHNKFLVVSDQTGPTAVWTGSTNWTMTGLCTQSNNAILVESAEIAGWYRSEWDLLVSAGNDYPDGLFTGNDVTRQTALAPLAAAQVWFAPVRGTIDLESARARINAATQGILFLMFNPGPAGTLLNDIVERTSSASPTFDPQLHIHGVINQDPSTTKHPVIGLLHRGELTQADIDVVLPAAVDSDFAFWLKELSYSLVMVHSKTIVVDPFGPNPCVMTGSHNMGPKASGKNDDNLMIIDGQPKLAEAYAVYIMGVYNQYRWRYYQREAEKGQLPATAAAGDAAPTWAGLIDDDTWQDKYFTAGSAQREIAFWVP
ncbi:MAG TPA: phospholipase D-like domain-containing protein [Streptosporangiaceae bacterium]|nr:phospholipase D-like domain-containing protein [Streptosporangiaceae bacterium]